MKALRLILFGIVLALFALFAFNNWERVPVDLPDGSKVLIFLPVIVFAAFLLGWLPVLALHLASRASWRRQMAKVERMLDEAQASGPRVAAQTAAPPMVASSSFPPAA